MDFERFYDVICPNGIMVDWQPLEDGIDFPMNISNCTITSEGKSENLNDGGSHYWIDGTVCIYDSENRLLAEWTWDSKQACYLNLKFYTTEDGINYCFLECIGEFHEGEGGYTGDNWIRNRYKIDSNGNRYLFSVMVVTKRPYGKYEIEDRRYYTSYNVGGKVVREKTIKNIYEPL